MIYVIMFAYLIDFTNCKWYGMILIQYTDYILLYVDYTLEKCGKLEQHCCPSDNYECICFFYLSICLVVCFSTNQNIFHSNNIFFLQCATTKLKHIKSIEADEHKTALLLAIDLSK